VTREPKGIFEHAAGLTGAERELYLRGVCGTDAGLRGKIEGLLLAHEQAAGFLATPTAGEPTLPIQGPTIHMASATIRGVLGEGPGTWIGPYKLLQLIGEGGFGSVFMAEQEQPVRRKVALKIIKLGMDTRQIVARFEQERQALAMMDHPNIARVLDAGATETGRPYFVMDLVKGDPIVEYCDRQNLSIRERLELFAQVCQAVQHAHTKGIIHRDLKPSNILVAMQDGRPSPKVIDFGIAKATSARLTEKTLFTEHRQLIGTPEYMSPEQAEGSLDIDTRTDVYSLGVLLYELLTGSTPFSSKDLRSAAFQEIQRIIREVEPPNPSTRLSQSTATIAGVAASRRTEPKKLGLIVRGELDWIVMKALEKDRRRRYETANGLGADVQRYLAGESVTAAPPHAAYRLRKFLKRNKGPTAAAGATAAALVLGMAGTVWQAGEARRERDAAVAARESESAQKLAAGEQRDRAGAAEAQAKSRAAELAEVAAFQGSMLSQIDATEAGERLMADVRARYSRSLERSGMTEEERESRNDEFGRELVRVNGTDAAKELIDLTILKPAITAIDAKFQTQPLVDARLRDTLATLYSSLGMYGPARELEERALKTRRELLGNDHADTLSSLDTLGDIVQSQGNAAEAEAYFRESLAGRLRTSGKEDAATLAVQSNLGNVLREEGKFAEAEPLLREALEVRRRVMGDSKRDTLVSMNTLGFLYVVQGKPDLAEPLWREAYENGRKALGEDDRDVLVWLNNLGQLLQTRGRTADAEALFREALAGHRRVLGEEHPSTIRVMGVLAANLTRQGKYSEAEPLARETLEKSRRVLGSVHPSTLHALVELGVLLKRMGNLTGAEACLSEGLDSYRKVRGREHPDTLATLGNMAGLHSDQGRFAEAEAEYRETWDASRRRLGDEHTDTLIQKVNLANCLLRREKTAEAEALIREALATRLRLSGEDQPETLIAQSNLARALEAGGKLDEAEDLLRAVLVKFRRVQGDDHPNTLNAIINLAATAGKNGKAEEAATLYREAAEASDRRYGKENLRSATARDGLGQSLKDLGRFGEAEPELLEAERVLKTTQGGTPERRAKNAAALAGLYEAWEKAEPGKGHGEKAGAWKAAAEAAAPTKPRGGEGGGK